MSIIPAYTSGGITRPALNLDSYGNIVLDDAASTFVATYGLKALYLGCPPGTPWPPVHDSISTPVDANAGANSVAEGAAANTLVGITASATSAIGPVTYSLVGDNSGGGFKINAATGVVTVNDPSKIDFESAPGHAYTISVKASDGILTSTQSFTINVTDVAPATPVDSNAGANHVAEGAAAGTTVGITAASTDVNGGAVTFAITGDTSGGGFKVDPHTGIVSVADGTKIDYESAPGHAYSVTIAASDGTLSNSQTFTIAVDDVTIGAPTDTNAAANQVAEGAAGGSTVGITASALDPNGPATTYSLVGDTSGGGFTINAATGVVTVADPTKIDFETSGPSHSYNITVQAVSGATTTQQTFTIVVNDVAPSAPVDSNAAANQVTEGAAAGTAVGVTASSTDVNGPAVTYSLIGDTSGGGFTINAVTGVVTVADPTKIDYESAAGHAYTVTAQASDGTQASSQTFTIAVTNVAPSTPVDSNAAANSVAEGAAAGSTVGVTASSTDVNGPAVTYSLIGDTSGGGFTINAATGVVTVADPTKIDYESAAGHAYTVTAQASDGTLTSSQTFTIAVTDVAPSTPVDSNAAANSIAEGAAAGTTVGITASSTDVNGPAVTYSLVGDTSGGGFTINATTGVITVADPTKIDYETAVGHAYTVTAQASDGVLASSQTFTIAVSDVAPTVPVDSNAAANTVAEGAANGSTVGITASSTDINGPAVTYSLIGDTSGGGFTINAATGVVTVADSTKIDFETSGAGHSYTVTAEASDGTLTSSQSFTVAVTDVAPSVPVDSNAAANSVAEGAAAGSTVGVTASSTDVNGPAVTYSLIGDTSGGGFTINATTGVVTVADPTKIDYESSGAGHSYTVTAQASDGTLTGSQTFTIAVADVAPSTPVDADATANAIVEGAANGSTVGITASSTDANGPAVTYSLTGDTSGGGFTINATTGVVTVADSTKIDFESSGPTHSYTVTAQASDGTLASSQSFTINVSDVAPSVPVDSDGTANQVSMNAPIGTYVGVTASSIDVNGPAVTYSLVGDTSGGGFTIDATTGQMKVADPTKIPYNAGSPTFDVTVQASDGTLTSQQTFTITVIPNTPPVANDDALSATEAGGANNSVPGSNPSGNVILGTGSAGAVQDTDAEDASSALTVVAVHTGAEGASTGTGTVGQDLVGLHGTLHLNSNGSYTYSVNQTDVQVQALHTSADTIQDKFNYTIQDTGGLQDTATITFTIHGADDLPLAVADTGTMTEDDAPTSFNVIANDSQDPDSTASNVITLAGGITVTGPAGETFANTDATASIVANQVQVTLNNAHFQQLAAGEHATVTVPYTLTGDTGETSSANLVVTVNGVNDVPVAVDDSGSMTEDQSGHAFTVLTNDTLDADHGAPNNVTVGTVTNLAAPAGEGIVLSDISVSVNGSNQVVVNLGSDFQHMQDGESATFDVPYTLHGDQAGDTSTATLHVTVTGINDAPTAANFTFNGSNSATGNTDLVVNDPTDGAPSTTGPNKTISASILSGASDVDGPGPLVVVAGTIATAHGGTVTMQSDGDFIYKAPVGYTGLDSFNYQVSDQNAGASGAGIGTGTITINVTTPKVWYVNADAATDGDGSSEHPFNTLTHFANSGVGNNVDGAGDTIFLETSSAHYTGNLTLENNEQLISQSAGLVVPDGSGGAGTVTLVSASGANAVIDGTVTLGSGNNIQGVDFGNTSGFALQGTNVGTSTIDNVKQGVITNTSGGGISITGSGNALTYDFGSITASGGTNGIVINGASGTVHAHGGAISNATGSDVSLSSGSLNFTYDGTISDNTGSTISISSMTGGTQAFTGAISSSGGTGIALSSNTGATLDFSGGINLSTGASNAFSATGGGTVNVTGTNHLTTTTGTALNVVNTNIGSSGLTFQDISANGGTNGIVLNNTGTAAGNGGLTVTGTGSAGSGGTIQNTDQGAILSSTKALSLSYMNFTNPNTGAGTVNNADDSTFNSAAKGGINLSSVAGVTLDHLSMNGNGGAGGVQTGITGQNVSDLTLSNSTVVGFGDNAAEGDVRLFNLSGTSNITNSTFGFVPGDATAGENLVDIRNNTGTLTLNVTGTTFHNTADSTNGSDGLQMTSTGSATVNLNVSGSTFTNLKTGGIDTFARQTSTMNVNITDGGVNGNGNSFTAGTVASRGIGLNAQDTAHLNFNVNRNTTISGYGGPILEIFGINSAVINGHVDNNANIANTGTTNRAGSPLDFDIEDNATAAISATGNTINNAGQDAAIVAFAAGDGGTVNNKASLDLTLASNTINMTGANLNANNFNNAILLNPGVNANDATTMTANIHNNTVTGITAGNGNVAFVIENTGGAGSHLYLENFNTDTNTTWNNNGNTPLNSTLELNAPGSSAIPGSHNGGHTITPSNPNALFAADGGVASATGSTGEMHLTQAELNKVVAATIADWAAAGLSSDKVALLQSVTYDVADITSGWLGQSTAKHVTIDVNADGHGWFVDPTPLDNFEFAHAVSSTHLVTDPTTAAAGHMDLLTTVMHEMGEQLGLSDQFVPADQGHLMFAFLSPGERVLPNAAEVAQANAAASSVQSVGITSPAPAQQASGGFQWLPGQQALIKADGFDFSQFTANSESTHVTDVVSHVMPHPVALGPAGFGTLPTPEIGSLATSGGIDGHLPLLLQNHVDFIV
ncbi:beta strand repeat-containing protein [Bradyrhizobium guangdongense]|uniref:Cadherin domain-containing protein n=1 Tax=Bradyrhizobium guangdongense TaxID=1325090 RepID=A0A410V0I1_9BRAD|nr:cadherin domain-containing protein [Bradyrhizobium guangdongense]QAU37166.1 hypothetical protein X265_05290 [Bradyrhizobium guangdongense]QOZ58221.1 hypothetical protein XH86_05290 [Bradyrhizobium guangdongense]GGI20989.1 hypothetical protein GCM10010987_12130 [Bradyrhizobium guangdongense]